MDQWDLDWIVGGLEMYSGWLLSKLREILEEDYSLGEKKANEIKAAIDALLKEKLEVINEKDST